MAQDVIGVAIRADLADFRRDMVELGAASKGAAREMAANLGREIRLLEASTARVVASTKQGVSVATSATSTAAATAFAADNAAAHVAGIGTAGLISAGQMAAAKRMIVANLINIGNVAIATRGSILAMATPLPDVITGMAAAGVKLSSLVLPIAAVTGALAIGYTTWKTYTDAMATSALRAEDAKRAHENLQTALERTDELLTEAAVTAGLVDEDEVDRIRLTREATAAWDENTKIARERLAVLQAQGYMTVSERAEARRLGVEIENQNQIYEQNVKAIDLVVRAKRQRRDEDALERRSKEQQIKLDREIERQIRNEIEMERLLAEAEESRRLARVAADAEQVRARIEHIRGTDAAGDAEIARMRRYSREAANIFRAAVDSMMSDEERLLAKREDTLQRYRTAATEAGWDIQRIAENTAVIQLSFDKMVEEKRKESVRRQAQTAVQLAGIAADAVITIAENQAARQKQSEREAFEDHKAFAIAKILVDGAIASAAVWARATSWMQGLAEQLVVAGTTTAATAIAASAQYQAHQGRGPGMSVDEDLVRVRRNEAVLSPQGVAAAGGSRGVGELNAGGGGWDRGGDVITVFEGRVVDRVARRQLRRRGGPLARLEQEARGPLGYYAPERARGVKP